MSSSSVSLPPELRKRIKKLAAEKDTSQSAIIEEAVNLLEKTLYNQKDLWNTEDIEYLKNISETVYRNNPKREKRVKKLLVPGPSIEDIIIANWTTDLVD